MERLGDAVILMGMLEGRDSHLLVAHMIEHLVIIYQPEQNRVLVQILNGLPLSEVVRESLSEG